MDSDRGKSRRQNLTADRTIGLPRPSSSETGNPPIPLLNPDPGDGIRGFPPGDNDLTAIPEARDGAATTSSGFSASVRSGRVHRALALADWLAIVFVVIIALLVDGAVAFSSAPDHPVLMAVFALLSWLVIAGMDGLFHVDDRRIDRSTSDEMFAITRTVGLWIWIVFGFDALITTPGAPSVSEAIFLGVLTVPTVLIARDLTRWRLSKRPWYRERVVIVGTNADRDQVRHTLERHPEYALEIVGETRLADAIPHPARNGDAQKSLAELGQFLLEVDADRLIFGTAYQSALEERTGTLRFLAEKGVKVDLVPGDVDELRIDAELHQIEGLPLVTLPSTSQPRYASVMKRGIDLTLASGALLLMSPILGACALAIKLDTHGPIFFRQPRVGRGRQTFSVFKFRTMVKEAEDLKAGLSVLNSRNDGMFKIPEDPRVTRVGRWLRRTSLDEVPQLINVLRGEMSLVGPRPLIQTEADIVDRRYEARFDVRPGITGPWQVFGRSDIPFEAMTKLDYTYVTNWSIGYDVKLMARTTSAILAGRGAY